MKMKIKNLKFICILSTLYFLNTTTINSESLEDLANELNDIRSEIQQ